MYTFKLQSVWNYRQMVEEQKQVEFAESKQQLEKEQAILAEIREEKAQVLRQLKSMQNLVFNAAEISLCLYYHKLFNEKEALQLELVLKADAEVTRRRALLMEAMQKRQVMDKLNEEQLREYKKALIDGERQSADETAVMRFARNKK